jgi:hypothetical protein
MPTPRGGSGWRGGHTGATKGITSQQPRPMPPMIDIDLNNFRIPQKSMRSRSK